MIGSYAVRSYVNTMGSWHYTLPGDAAVGSYPSTGGGIATPAA
jgi:hypothetical protein